MNKTVAILTAASFTLFINGQISQGIDGLNYDTNQTPGSGVVEQYYEDGSLKAEIMLAEGIKEGESVFYYPSGIKNEIRSYHNDVKHGKWLTWSDNGVKTGEAHFVNGMKDGTWYVWDESGTLRAEMTYSMGEKAGTWRLYDENGQLTGERNY